jgi:hypothetical protein
MIWDIRVEGMIDIIERADPSDSGLLFQDDGTNIEF